MTVLHKITSNSILCRYLSLHLVKKKKLNYLPTVYLVAFLELLIIWHDLHQKIELVLDIQMCFLSSTKNNYSQSVL